MTVLVVAEKPSVARDIAQVLGARARGDGHFSGGGWIVTWAIGHLVALAEPHDVNPAWKRWRLADLPIVPPSWPLVVGEKTKEQYAVVRRLLVDPAVRGVVCATDAGREGELIFRYVYEAARSKKPVKRLWISSLTAEAIARGFKSLAPGSDFDRLADAARARSRADWLVGMNLSRVYSLLHDDHLSVGRVQTPTLAMLVQRELEIRDFVPEDYLEVVADFGDSGGGGGKYTGTYVGASPGKNEAIRFAPDAEEAAAIVLRAKTGAAKVDSVERKTRRLPPPQLYDLTDLQRHANRLYGFTAQRTLQIAQKLYEERKLITYPRTSSRYLSETVAGELPGVVRAIAEPYRALLAEGTGARPLGKRFVDDAHVTDHHAIIPTDRAAPEDLTSDERRIYDLVCRRLLSAWHGDHVYAVTSVITVVTNGETKDRYLATGTSVEERGWKVLDVTTARAKEPPPGLPGGLERGQTKQVLDARAVEKQTRPPPRFTDATLLTMMETAGRLVDEKEISQAMRECGLGTPATRAAIIETLLTRGYVVRDEKTFAATDKGIALVAMVHPHVKSPAMTGEWEAKLTRIERGAETLAGFMSAIEAYVRDVITNVTHTRPEPNGPRSSRADLLSAAYATQEQAASSPAPPPPKSSRARRLVRGDDEPETHPWADHEPEPPAREHRRPPRPSRNEPVGSNGARTQPRPNRDGTGDARPSRAEPTGDARVQLGPSRDARPSREGGAVGQLSLSALEAPAVVARVPRGERPSDLGGLLQRVFGFGGFRPYQEDVCRAAAAGRDVLLVMPTGAGKSLCYQLPGLARGGTTLVVSPLIALMEDQVAQLTARGVAAERIHSGRPRLASRAACQAYLDGALDFLFIAPERLRVPGFPEMLARRKPTLIAIDEAHCISQWGHDFRPDYRLLGERLPLLRPAPVIALTATATRPVQDDIGAQLRLDAPARFIHGFRRDNIAVEVIERNPSERTAIVKELLADPARRPAIVYTPTRSDAEKVAGSLKKMRAAAYHAGLSANVRDEVQSAFLGGALDVIVATTAFGMGIDKPDVRTVIHTALPSSLEGYYQEIGRAGRDGKPSRAVLLWSFVDTKTHEFFLERDYPETSVVAKVQKALPPEGAPVAKIARKTKTKSDVVEKALEKLVASGGATLDADGNAFPAGGAWRPAYEAARARKQEALAKMRRYAETATCRMLQLVTHFGDQHDGGAPCGACDVCAPETCIALGFRAPSEREDAAATKVLAALRERDGRTVGQLHRDVVGDKELDRRGLEHVLGALARAGAIALVGDALVKDGKTIPFQRVWLKNADGTTNAALRVIVTPPPRPQKKGAWFARRKRKPKTSTKPRRQK
ncbi:MAG: DNA topoisomerase 3 [Labilithrix sp.]|nr:DNA topoisomerase 3 [Labilithrix sp.]MCW5815373.1 DNA topoisomerase 3 [Labilithrix sp.]